MYYDDFFLLYNSAAQKLFSTKGFNAASMRDVAKELNIRPHLISQLLNDNLNKNFSSFINEYRINEAKRIMVSEGNLKIEVIAEMCGFNSNSTFYSAFKKFTNTTPSKYLSSSE